MLWHLSASRHHCSRNETCAIFAFLPTWPSRRDVKSSTATLANRSSSVPKSLIRADLRRSGRVEFGGAARGRVGTRMVVRAGSRRDTMLCLRHSQSTQLLAARSSPTDATSDDSRLPPSVLPRRCQRHGMRTRWW